jgi:hypothetical protein
MTTQIEKATQMIHQYIESIGLTQEQVYNADKKSWRWLRGSANVEVFIQTITFQNGSTRDYLRIFSPLMKLPVNDLLAFYRHLLQLNDTNLGVKISIMPGSQWVYATYERDLRGMDYHELATCIADMEYWADSLDDELKTAFPDWNN